MSVGGGAKPSLSPEEWASASKEIVRLAQHKSTRNTHWTPEIPCEWNPTQVENPNTGMPFSDAGAWMFVVELIESGHAFSKKVLRDKPPGAIAWETKIPLSANRPKLYLKVQLWRGKVLGRSFHYSTVKDKEGNDDGADAAE